MTTHEHVRANFQQLLKDRQGVNIDVLLMSAHPAFGSVHTVLDAGETIEGYCLGPMNDTCRVYLPNKWLILVSNSRIILLMKGFISGLVCHSILLSEITSITFERKWLNGNLQIKSTSLDVGFYQINKTDLACFEQACERVRPGR